MARREEPIRAYHPKQSAGPRRARGPQAPAREERSPGAAAQLAEVHRTLRHGPAVQLQAGGANRTGLPDRLKSGVEALSGLSLDDVKVHRNSARPAELQAHAYTQGTDIHLAPGQEQHLPHEAWHVVQQKQGRVKPTLQMKGVPINDDGGLEREADVRGAQALAAGGSFAAGSLFPLSRGQQAGTVAQAVTNHKGKRLTPKFSDNFKAHHIAGDNATRKTIFDGRNVRVNTTATEAAWVTAINGNDTEFAQGAYAHNRNIRVDVNCVETRAKGQHSTLRVRNRRIQVVPALNRVTANHIG